MSALLQRSTYINFFSLSQSQSSQVHSTLWAASQMAGSDDWLLSAAAAQGSCRDHHHQPSCPAVLLSVCLSVFVACERQLTVEVRVGSGG